MTNMWDATWGVRDRDRSSDKYVGCHMGGVRDRDRSSDKYVGCHMGGEV